jgi:hypothetical protein
LEARLQRVEELASSNRRELDIQFRRIADLICKPRSTVRWPTDAEGDPTAAMAFAETLVCASG